MLGFARCLHPLGVAVPELSATGLRQLLGWGHLPLPVLADTSAFSEVEMTKEGPRVVRPILPAEWLEILDVQTRIAEIFGDRAFVVAPDQVGDQAKTLARLEEHGAAVRKMRAMGARVIVAIQRGALLRSHFDVEIAKVLGFEDFVRGIPSNKDATRPEELAELLHGAHPSAVHFLGLGPKHRRFRKLHDLVARICPGASVSCDSNPLPAMIGTANGQGGGPRMLTALHKIVEQTGIVGKDAAAIRSAAVFMTFSQAIFAKGARTLFEEATGERVPRSPVAPLQLDLWTRPEAMPR